MTDGISEGLLLSKIIEGLFAFIVAGAGGVFIKNQISKSKRDDSQNKAEASVFDKALADCEAKVKELTMAELDAWARVHRLEAELNTARLEAGRDAMRIQRLIVKRFPEAVQVFDTQMGDIAPQPPLNLPPIISD